MMRLVPGLAIATAVVSLTIASGCANAKAQAILPESTPLSVPQAPGRVVVPPAPEPPPPAVETAPASSSTSSANPPANGTRPNRDARPPAAPPPNPPAATPPATPATPLETQANQTDLENRARGLIAAANAALDKINYVALSSDGKAQHDTARRFTKQAHDALTAKNVVYAWQLADKANTIATLLLRS